MHRHFTDAGCVLMFGGGMKKGFLHGKTADERPCKTIEKPRRHRRPARHDLPRRSASPRSLSYEIEKRPFYVTRDGLGKPILDLLLRSA